jgi:hypothetical protein
MLGVPAAMRDDDSGDPAHPEITSR